MNMTTEDCAKACSLTEGCVAAGRYGKCDLLFHSTTKPTTCPSGFNAYAGNVDNMDKYTGVHYNGYEHAKCVSFQ